jgi:hypothetical protein
MNDLAAYRAEVAAKRVRFTPRGLTEIPALHPALTPLQRHGVEFGLRCGTSALFYDTGLGKTLAELDWCRVVQAATGKPAPIVSPLGVTGQHCDEAAKFGIAAQVVRDPAEIVAGVVPIFNYDILDKFSAVDFGGISLDESSILKSFTGATTRMLIQRFADVPFRLEASATPAPNDYTEIGQHAEFLGVMRSSEMLSRFFINDSMSAGKYRLKRPAVRDFWDWVASWSRAARLPSDLGFPDDGYVLPPLEVIDHTIEADRTLGIVAEKDGQVPLFRMPENSATSIHREKRLTLSARADLSAAVVKCEVNEPWIVWVETDAEEEAMTARLPDFVAVRGSHLPSAKEKRLLAFSRGELAGIVTKPSIAGFGLNWQHCARQVFVGLSFSFEMYYQAIRRSWRFGQRRPVQVHVVGSDTERNIRAIVARKEADHNAMLAQMRAAMQRAAAGSLNAIESYHPQQEARLPAWLN